MAESNPEIGCRAQHPHLSRLSVWGAALVVGDKLGPLGKQVYPAHMGRTSCLWAG